MSKSLPPDAIRQPSGPGSETESQARLLATILIANLHNAVLAGSRLVMPIIALDLGAGKALVGLIAALFTAAPMLISVRFGKWADTSGTLAPMIVCAAVILVACTLMVALPSVALMFAAAALIGLGAVLSHIVATRAVASFGPQRYRTRHLGYLAIGYSFFQFVGPLIAGVSYDHFGSRAAFAALGILPALALGLLWSGHRHLYVDAQAEEARKPNEAASTGLAKLPRLRKWVTVYGLFSGSHTLFPFTLSLYIVEIGLSASQGSLLLGSMAVGAMVARLGAPYLDAIAPSGPLLAAALVVAALGYAVMPLAQNWMLLLMLSAGLGLSLGVGVPIATSLIYDAAPSGRINEAMGLTMSVTNFLQLALPLLLGVVAAKFGVTPMFWALAAGLLVASAIAGWSRDSH